ncbi:hypothetical protein, partial [Streptomyces sp. NPDC048312]|uniref:hypothetical protein n=1 Tax=Streptomyces sp. NPDC048312 TaxID=3155485 RepID=UPI0033C6ED48
QTPTELVALRADGDVLPPLPDGRHRWVHRAGAGLPHGYECSDLLQGQSEVLGLADERQSSWVPSPGTSGSSGKYSPNAR